MRHLAWGEKAAFDQGSRHLNDSANERAYMTRAEFLLHESHHIDNMTEKISDIVNQASMFVLGVADTQEKDQIKHVEFRKAWRPKCTIVGQEWCSGATLEKRKGDYFDHSTWKLFVKMTDEKKLV